MASATDLELFDQLVDRLERAKTRPEFQSWPEYKLRLRLAEKLIGEGRLAMGNFELEKAERSLLRREVVDLALASHNPEKISSVFVLLEGRKYDEAMALAIS